jgi:putative hydrolase of the HAD superfamily
MGSSETTCGRTAVVFDLWGTLIPFPHTAWDKVLAQTASALGAGLEEFLAAWHADYANRAVGDLESSLRRVCQQAGVIVNSARIRTVLGIRRAALSDIFVPRPDAAPTLRQLRARGYRTGLITNCTSEIPQLWLSSPLSPLINATVFSCAEGLRKPDLAIYELAASRLGVDSDDCVFVGDGADEELDGASVAGMHAILLRAGDTHPPEGWKGPVIQRLSDVITLLPEQPVPSACQLGTTTARDMEPGLQHPFRLRPSGRLRQQAPPRATRPSLPRPDRAGRGRQVSTTWFASRLPGRARGSAGLRAHAAGA